MADHRVEVVHIFSDVQGRLAIVEKLDGPVVLHETYLYVLHNAIGRHRLEHFVESFLRYEVLAVELCDQDGRHLRNGSALDARLRTTLRVEFVAAVRRCSALEISLEMNQLTKWFALSQALSDSCLIAFEH